MLTRSTSRETLPLFTVHSLTPLSISTSGVHQSECRLCLTLVDHLASPQTFPSYGNLSEQPCGFNSHPGLRDSTSIVLEL